MCAFAAPESVRQYANGLVAFAHLRTGAQNTNGCGNTFNISTILNGITL
jgi:hypothetical protein